MATATTLITRAARMLGLVEPNSTLDTSISADFFIGLNAMLESWQNESLTVYDVREDTKTLVVGQVTYTIGSSGDFNIPRPTFVEGLFIRAGGIDYPPMKKLLPDQYAAIAQKTAATSDIPDYYKFEIDVPLASVTIWPAPSATNTLYLRSYRVIAAFAAAGDTVTLPAGYEDALTYNLAVRMMPEYPQSGAGMQMVIQLARNTKRIIKRTNTQALIMALPVMAGSKSDIYAGA